MIQYTLRCADGHRFDSWFQSAAAFDTLRGAGHLSCTICGSATVEKAPMAPRIGSRSGETAPAAAPTDPDPRPDPRHEALARLRAHVETNADYVGTAFSDEARAMHDGTAPARSIWGEAKPAEARKLIEDGVPVAPLPFKPKRKLT